MKSPSNFPKTTVTTAHLRILSGADSKAAVLSAESLQGYFMTSIPQEFFAVSKLYSTRISAADVADTDRCDSGDLANRLSSLSISDGPVTTLGA
jgi:hypothetical protein